LSAIFDDELDGEAGLIYTIVSNTDHVLVDASIDEAARALMLVFTNHMAGQSEITIRAENSLGVSTDVTFTVTVLEVNEVPTITPIEDQVIDEDSATGLLPFTIADGDHPSEQLTVTASTDETSLIPLDRII